jgi:hypothetical protein
MLGVYFGTPSVFILIIVLVWHFLSSVLTFFILSQIYTPWLINELLEESDQFRLLHVSCLPNLRVLLVWSDKLATSTMRISITLNLSIFHLGLLYHCLVGFSSSLVFLLFTVLVWHFCPSDLAFFYSDANKHTSFLWTRKVFLSPTQPSVCESCRSLSFTF